MAPNSSNRGEVGRYLAMSQIGLEMVVPIGLGMYLDRRFSWQPWGVVCGAVLGLSFGVFRLIRLVNQEERQAPSGKKPDQS